MGISDFVEQERTFADALGTRRADVMLLDADLAGKAQSACQVLPAATIDPRSSC
jgi:hypothetical protein